MPAYLRGRQRTEFTFVPINTVLMYGWKSPDLTAGTGVSGSDLTALGHLDATAAAAVSGAILVSGANAPKPPRVTKRIPGATVNQRGQVSTFAGYNALTTAAAAGWYVSKRGRGVNLRPASPGARTQTAIAELSNGLMYAFALNQADFTTYATALGLQSASEISDTEALKLVRGSKTKPGQAAIELESGAQFTTFYSSAFRDDAAAAGFQIKSLEVLEF